MDKRMGEPIGRAEALCSASSSSVALEQWRGRLQEGEEAPTPKSDGSGRLVHAA